ncbi:hypothetical protein Cni_G02412 [Canna indica]|uniref:BED-type domain-containing protein n=1 Tax=Canna indica TaxID=4628 RepID=A0AAQ3Q2Q4_9LILI|nr:hypothetical protein Cni_G02412 [Canna indica]
MAPKSQSDPAWHHSIRLEKPNHWQCIHCNMIYRGGGVTRLKLNKPSSTDELHKIDGGHYEARGGGDEENLKFESGIQASLEHVAFERDRMYYPGSFFEYGGGSGSGGTSSVGSISTTESMDRSGSIPSAPHIGQSSSMRVPQSKGGSRGGIRGFFTNLGANGKLILMFLILISGHFLLHQQSNLHR